MPDAGLQSVALQIQPPNTFTTLGNIMNVARGAVELQRSRATLGADIERAKAESSSAQTHAEANKKLLDEANGIRSLDAQSFMDEQGNLDWNKFAPAVLKAAPTLGPEHLSRVYTSVQQHAAAKQSLLTLDTNQLGATANFLGGMVGKEPAEILTAMDGYQKIVPATAPGFAILKGQLQTAKTAKEATEIIRRAQLAVTNLAGQKSALEPSAIPVSTGAESAVVQGGAIPGQAGQGPQQGQILPGTVAVQQPGPTTPQYDERNVQYPLGAQPGALSARAEQEAAARQGMTVTPAPRPGTPEYAAYQQVRSGSVPTAYVPQGGGGAPAAAPGPALRPSGPNPMVAGTQQAQIDTMHKDYGENAVTARGALQNIGVLESIKAIAPKAVTGVEADRRAYLVGIAGLLGMDKAQAEKTATDVLQKQTSMLVQGAGHTDAERMLVAAMTPNSHMTPEAIRHAADIVIAQQKMPLIRQQHLQQFIGDPARYNAEMADFNRHADPRLLQWKGMSKEERADMLKAMSADEKSRFLEGGRWLEKQGLYK